MTQKYYLSNVHWGLIIFGIATYLLREDAHEVMIKFLIGIFFLSALLFPFAKKGVETFALKYTTHKSWTTGFYTETPAKNGIYAMFYMVIYAVTIPVAVIYLLYLASTKKAT